LRNYFRTNASQSTNSAFAQDQVRFFGGRLQLLFSGRFTQATLNQPVFSGI